MTPEGTFKRGEMASFCGALAQELHFSTVEDRQWLADANTMVALGCYAGMNKPTENGFCNVG